MIAVRGFPVGSLSYGERGKRFYAVGLAKGGGFDVDAIAEAYRKKFGEQMQNRSEDDVMRWWESFCEFYAAAPGWSAY